MTATKPARNVVMTHQPVALFKILKFEGLVGSGGLAKLVIADGQVSVNGKPELRKGRKIVAGDVISLGDDTLQMTSL